MSLSPAPLSLLIKAAPILTEEMYGDIQPAAWELLLSMDEHMAGAAGKKRSPMTLVAPSPSVYERSASIPFHCELRSTAIARTLEPYTPGREAEVLSTPLTFYPILWTREHVSWRPLTNY